MGNQITFELGKKIQHRYTKDYLWMLKEGREQILCRTKDLREIWFYPNELEELTNTLGESRNRSNRFL